MPEVKVVYGMMAAASLYKHACDHVTGLSCAFISSGI